MSRASGSSPLTVADRLGIGIPMHNDQAVCRDKDPDIWFPSKGKKNLIKLAKSLCESCPVREACLDWVLEQESQDRKSMPGIWAALGLNERRKMRRCSYKGCKEKPVENGYCENILHKGNTHVSRDHQKNKDYPVKGRIVA